MIAALVMVIPAAAAAGVGDNIDVRSRAFVRQLDGCDAMVSLTIQLIQASPNDVLGASDAINKAKDTCHAIKNRMYGMDTRHFSDQALNGEVAVDYWERGLGRFSNYLDTGHASDVSKAAEYFTTARTFKGVALRGVNRRRAVYGLGPIK